MKFVAFLLFCVLSVNARYIGNEHFFGDFEEINVSEDIFGAKRVLAKMPTENSTAYTELQFTFPSVSYINHKIKSKSLIFFLHLANKIIF